MMDDLKKKDDFDEEERERVMEYVRKEVEDWDDEEKARSRFKGLSGQTSDYEWQSRYLFWKQLIINVAKHLGTFIIRPHQLKFVWFRRGSLSPLCLDSVLVEMHNNGDLLTMADLVDPKAPRLSQVVHKVVRFVRRPSPLNPQYLTDDYFILSPLLKDKALQVVQLLSETHWTPSCVITMNKFLQICGGLKEASAVLSHLSESGKAKYFSIRRRDLLEGVKVALSPGAVSGITSLDYDVLHLDWTVERLEQQLNVIDCRCKSFKRLALASLKSGDRKSALRHARDLKLASQGREKCATLLNQVEEVLRVIADAESSKKVSEAIIIGARAMKENRVNAEEVEQALQELDETIASQKQVDKLLESTSSYFGTEDEDIEDELRQLELDITMETIQAPVKRVGVDSSVEVFNALEITNSLSSALSDVKLRDDAAMESEKHETQESMDSHVSKNVKLKLPESFL